MIHIFPLQLYQRLTSKLKALYKYTLVVWVLKMLADKSPTSCLYMHNYKRELYLMFQGTVLPLRLFADNHKVQILVSCLESWQTFNDNYVGKQVYFSSKM